MSVEKKIGALAQHEYLGVWKKTSSPTDIRTVRTGITAYLCEHMKEGVDREAALANNHPNHLRRGLDYLTKEESGRLKVYGFLREDVLKLTGQIPHKMKNDDLVEASLQAWEGRLKRKRIERVAHKYVLSLPPDLCEVMAKTGHSADTLLCSSVCETMRRYQEKYYPDQKISYLVGIHHDRAHIHAHVMLFPTTGSGKLLRVSDESKERGNRKPFQFMRKVANKAVSRFFEYELKRQSPASIRSPARFTQSKLLALAVKAETQRDPAVKDLPEEDKRLNQYQKYHSLLEGDPEKMRTTLREGYKSQMKLYEILMEIRETEPELLLKHREASRTIRARQSQEMSRLLEQRKRLNHERQQLRFAKRELFDDLGKWRSYRFPNGSISEIGNDLRDPQVAEWLIKTMTSSDRFGELVRDYVANKQANDERIELPKKYLRAMAGASNPVAAEKFTAKDRFARQCIEYSAGRIVGPAYSMLERYYRQNTTLSTSSQKDFVREFLQDGIELHREKLKGIHEQAEGIQRQINALRIDQGTAKINEDVIDAAIRGRPPAFLEEFTFCCHAEKEIPIDGLIMIRLGRQNIYEPEVRKTRSEKQFQADLSDILKTLREHRMATQFPIYVGVAPAPPTTTIPKSTTVEQPQDVVSPENTETEVEEENQSIKPEATSEEFEDQVIEKTQIGKNTPGPDIEMDR